MGKQFFISVFFACWFLPTAIFAQSLEQEVWSIGKQEFIEDTTQILKALKYSYEHRLSDVDTAYYYAQKALKSSQKINFFRGISRSYRFLGFIYEQTDKSDSVKIWLWKAIDAAKSPEVHSELSRAYAALVSHYKAFEYPPIDSCFYYLTQMDRITEKTGNYRQLLYREYGELYELTSQYKKAEEYFNKMLQYAIETQMIPDQHIAYFYLINVARKAGDQVAYSNYLNDYLQLKGKLDSETLESKHHAGLLLLATDSLEKAIPTLQTNLKLHLSLNHIQPAISTLFYLAKAYEKTNDDLAALNALEQMIAISGNQTKVNMILLTYQETSRLAAKLGDWEKAIFYQNKFTETRDQMYRNEQRERMDELAVAFEAEKQEKAIRIQALELKEKTNQRNLLIGSSAFLLIIAISIYFGAKQILDTRKQLAKQNAILQEQDILHLTRQKKLTEIKGMAKGQEVERLRVAKDLQQNLGILLEEVNGALKQTFAGQVTDPELVQKTKLYLNEAKEEMERIAHDLHPQVLLNSGLNGALQAIKEQIIARGLKASLTTDELPNNIAPERASTIYRIVQEIVQNAFKHADATKITILTKVEGEQLNVTVSDNGKGMVRSPKENTRGIGMKNIRSRMDYLGGNYDINSSKGEGTTFQLAIPISTEKNHLEVTDNA